MPFVVLPILWIAVAAGRRINALALGGIAAQSSALERSLFGAGAGLTLTAYGILALGVAGHLSPVPMIAWLALLAIVGGPENLAMGREITGIARWKPNIFSLLVALGFAAFAVIALFGCFTPPYPMEWDSMSYHLSDPAIHVEHHRIIPLPWESHSNFAFTMEMLYSIGLMAHSIPLAKLFHFSMAVIAAAGVWAIGRRTLDAETGALAALLLVSMPLVFWEAGTAYVDLAAIAYAVLGFLALTIAVKQDNPRWLALMAVMLGCMLSIKATSIFTIVAYSAAAALWLASRGVGDDSRWNVPAGLKGAVAIGAAALVIGSPWYIKSWVVTGNPVYPFAYGLFGGRHWDAANARLYTSNQVNFGVGHADPKTKMPIGVDLLMAPWNLTMFTMPGHIPPASSKPNPFYDIPTTMASLSPMLLAALFLPGFRRTRAPLVIRASLWLSLALLIPWAFSSQQERYLMPILPLLSLVSADCLLTFGREKMMAARALEALFGLSLAFSLFAGQQAISFEAPVALGHITRDAFLERNFPAYQAFEYLNAQPHGSGVVLYGEPLGLYCEQPYMWGEPTHGKVIPYDTLATPNDLRAYLLAHGFRYILVNFVGAPLQNGGPGSWSRKVYALTTSPPVAGSGSVQVFRL
ncbi:MAG: glycosyltransferase family 39 protein [Capsulimonadaceae bacterium]|nr:glycosyltransferase family 39 protein [Capsulimonadaceae bacterium]